MSGWLFIGLGIELICVLITVIAASCSNESDWKEILKGFGYINLLMFLVLGILASIFYGASKLAV